MRFRSLLLLLVGLIFVSFLTLPIVKADSLEPVEQGTDIELFQTCNNCTYCNLTSIRRVSPTSLNLLTNVTMIQYRTEYRFLLSGGNTTIIGDYKYCYDCGNLNERKTGCIDFSVTPSGEKNVLGFFIIIILLAYGVGFIGFFGKNEWVSIIGGLSMLSLGLYIALVGIDVYRNFMTLSLSYFSIGLGAIFIFVPLLEMIKGNY